MADAAPMAARVPAVLHGSGAGRASAGRALAAADVDHHDKGVAMPRPHDPGRIPVTGDRRRSAGCAVTSAFGRRARRVLGEDPAGTVFRCASDRRWWEPPARHRAPALVAD
ncbi:hypothetical protein ACH40E_36110 [Streptomyces acidicola]|uniref:hypothetical protein n=1 Tax=Streptomyces acidicola TaxID=2596892 RepID=UPI0037B1F1E9